MIFKNEKLNRLNFKYSQDGNQYSFVLDIDCDYEHFDAKKIKEWITRNIFPETDLIKIDGNNYYKSQIRM